MIEITFKDGDTRTYDDNSYTDYRYYKEVFVIINGSQWIGIYSMDVIKAIEVKQSASRRKLHVTPSNKSTR